MNNSETLQIVFSGVVALSTVFYCILTWKLVSETKRMREFQITPDINVYFENSETDASFKYIVFINSGLGYAKNVKVEILKDFQHYDAERDQLENKGVIKKGISSFYSNQFHRFYFTDLSKKYKEKLADSVQMRVTYSDINNRKYSKQITLSLDELSGISKMTPPDSYIGRISYELSEIKRLLKKDSDI